jgi:hypothetical protein
MDNDDGTLKPGAIEAGKLVMPMNVSPTSASSSPQSDRNPLREAQPLFSRQRRDGTPLTARVVNYIVLAGAQARRHRGRQGRGGGSAEQGRSLSMLPRAFLLRCRTSGQYLIHQHYLHPDARVSKGTIGPSPATRTLASRNLFGSMW